MVNGKREWVTYNTQDVDDSDFIQMGQEYDKEMNINIHTIGNAQVRLIRQRPLVDWATKWMEKNRE